MSTNDPKQIAQAYNSKLFKATVLIHGIDSNTGHSFDNYFTFDGRDPEFTQMLNDYAARQMAEQMSNEWLPVNDKQPKDNVVVKVENYPGLVYRNGIRWYSASQERRIAISPTSFQLAKPKS